MLGLLVVRRLTRLRLPSALLYQFKYSIKPTHPTHYKSDEFTSYLATEPHSLPSSCCEYDDVFDFSFNEDGEMIDTDIKYDEISNSAILKWILTTSNPNFTKISRSRSKNTSYLDQSS